jgi:hypothetical protein
MSILVIYQENCMKKAMKDTKLKEVFTEEELKLFKDGKKT